MEDVRRRIKRKQPVPSRLAVKKIRPVPSPARARLQGQNLVQPSPGQSVAGAPLLAVNEAGAPPNVARPRNGAPQMSTRMRKKLVDMMEQPALGCSKCRKSPIGCKECRQTRDCWLFLHQLDA